MTDLQQVPSASSNPLVPSGSSSLKTSHSAASSKASGAKSNPPSKSSSRSGSGKIAESSGSGGVVKQPTRAPPAPRALPSHPKYRQMVVEAIRNLHDRSGSSRQAILKYIVHKYSVGENQKLVNNNVKLALCSAVKIGDLKQTKGVGASGSFKISSATSKIKGGQRKAGRPKKIVKPKKAAAATKGKSPAKGAKRTPPKIKGGKKTALKKKPGVRKIVAAGPSTKGAGSKTKKPGSKAKTAPKASRK